MKQILPLVVHPVHETFRRVRILELKALKLTQSPSCYISRTYFLTIRHEQMLFLVVAL